MYDCNISINAPKRYLKGAGLNNTTFLPAWIYKIHINLKNTSEKPKLCSFTVTLGNGIRHMDNIQLSGPDRELLKIINVIEPSPSVRNNNVIVFANNFILSPKSENIISFDTCLYDKYTENSIENSGKKIPHGSKINFSGHLIYDETVDSCRYISEAADYELLISCDDDKISHGEFTKYYIECRAGQYDMAKSVYVRSILDEGLEFISDSSNLEPQNVYPSDKKTVLKWSVGNLQPSETKKIGYKVKLKEDFKSEDILKNKLNSNCVNNSTYTQCPSSCEYNLKVV